MKINEVVEELSAGGKITEDEDKLATLLHELSRCFEQDKKQLRRHRPMTYDKACHEDLMRSDAIAWGPPPCWWR